MDEEEEEKEEQWNEELKLWAGYPSWSNNAIDDDVVRLDGMEWDGMQQQQHHQQRVE